MDDIMLTDNILTLMAKFIPSAEICRGVRWLSDIFRVRGWWCGWASLCWRIMNKRWTFFHRFWWRAIRDQHFFFHGVALWTETFSTFFSWIFWIYPSLAHWTFTLIQTLSIPGEIEGCLKFHSFVDFFCTFTMAKSKLSCNEVYLQNLVNEITIIFEIIKSVKRSFQQKYNHFALLFCQNNKRRKRTKIHFETFHE